jgi:hypothetical protein
MCMRVVRVGQVQGADVVYIGRPRSGQAWRFGNPFVVGVDGERDECVAKFAEWLRTGNAFGCAAATPERLEWIHAHMDELRGKQLACFCAPRRCHGDVYVEWLDFLDTSTKPGE